MLLHHRDFGGDGQPPLVILHGLLGSSRNWQAAGADLARRRRVLAVDLRNHGRSPHAQTHDYPAMESDVVRWLDAQGLERVTLLGHSMGGKVAMGVACHHPDRVASLVVVDIAPRDYRLDRHAPHFEAMAQLDLASLASRAEAEARLLERVRDWPMMKFLATNLERTEAGRFTWTINLPVLHAELHHLGASSLAPDDRYEGPALFVVGGRSDYVGAADATTIRRHFPAAETVVLPGSGHNPHIEARAEFVAAVERHL